MKTKFYILFIILISYSCEQLFVEEETIPISDYWEVNIFDDGNKIDSEIPSGFWLERKLDSLPSKTYTFEFISMFNDTLAKDIFVDSNFVLPQDLIDFYNITSIDVSILNNFEKQDTLLFFHEGSGCFYFEKNFYKIFLEDENLKIVQDKDGEILPLEIKNLKQKLKTLIRKGKKYHGKGGCTSVDRYYFKKNNNIFSIYDGSCSWNGMETFLKN